MCKVPRIVSLFSSVVALGILLLATAPKAWSISPSDIADPGLANHLPRIVAQPHQSAFTVWAISTKGVVQRRYNLNTNSWGQWQLFGYPNDAANPMDLGYAGPSLCLTSGVNGYGSIQFGAFAYLTNAGGVHVALPHAVANGPVPSDQRWHTEPVPNSVITSPIFMNHEFRGNSLISDSNYDFTVYGTTEVSPNPRPNDDVPLIAYQVIYKTPWPNLNLGTYFTNHGRPEFSGVAGNVAVGPNSGVGVPLQTAGGGLNHHVFVKAVTTNNNHITYRYKDKYGQPAWGEDLGAPRRTEPGMVDGPLAFYTRLPEGFRIHVFVTAKDAELQRYQLYERTWTYKEEGKKGSWSSRWKTHGWPIDIYNNNAPLLNGDTPFRMTTYAIWEHKGKQRINLFGYANAEGAAKPQRLIEFTWDGNSWGWMGSHKAPNPKLGMKAESMAVLQTLKKKRFSVICRATDGRIYEHYFIISGNQWIGWKWHDLTN